MERDTIAEFVRGGGKMGFYLDNQGSYYEGDRADIGHQGVPQRPSADYKLVDGEWVLDDAVIKARQEEEIKAKLAEIDLKSIRSIREWVAAQANAPQYVKDFEAEAVAERVKLSPIVIQDKG